MKEKTNVLILTDGSNDTTEMAAGIAAEIAAAFKGSKVQVKTAAEFQGNDILPAEVFFLGCQAPKPDSFAYLADVLAHINLAQRPCGVFSPASQEAAAYLAALVRDSDAALNPTPLFAASAAGSSGRKWVRNTVCGLFRRKR